MSTAESAPPVAGVDGCRGGWVVVTAGPDLAAEFVDDLSPVVDRVRRGELAVMAIDMPIGLLDDRARRCDLEARGLLGPRRASVFPAPVRATLAATDYVDACRRSRAVVGRALSKQAYHLLDKIRDLDELLLPTDADTIVEAHPECAFARLAGCPLESKHTARGRGQRVDLLRSSLGPPFDRLRRAGRPRVPEIDLLDAVVLTVTARHVVAGTAIWLGGELDATGKRAQIVY